MTMRWHFAHVTLSRFQSCPLSLCSRHDAGHDGSAMLPPSILPIWEADPFLRVCAGLSFVPGSPGLSLFDPPHPLRDLSTRQVNWDLHRGYYLLYLRLAKVCSSAFAYTNTPRGSVPAPTLHAHQLPLAYVRHSGEWQCVQPYSGPRLRARGRIDPRWSRDYRLRSAQAWYLPRADLYVSARSLGQDCSTRALGVRAGLNCGRRGTVKPSDRSHRRGRRVGPRALRSARRSGGCRRACRPRPSTSRAGPA